jgi:ABC-2 type transport system permease protein
MKIHRLYALCIKEALQIIRDPSAILIAVALPMILLFLMGYAISLDSKNIPIGVVIEKHSSYARSLSHSFLNSKSFQTQVSHNKREFEKKIQEGTIRAIIIIPATFASDIAKGKPSIQILADGTEPNIAGYVQKYTTGLWQNWLTQEGLDGKNKEVLIGVETRYWFNAPLLSSYFLLPGSIAIVLTLIGTLLSALVVAREWERSTMEALMSTPLSIYELILGKLIPYFILGLISTTLCVAIAIGWFELPFRGSFVLLFLCAALYLFPSLSLGLLISTLAKNQFVAAQAALIVGFLPAFLLSGFIFQISSMPLWLQTITYVLPARYLVEILQTLFLTGNIAQVIIPNMIAMAFVGVVIFAIIIKITRKRLD